MRWGGILTTSVAVVLVAGACTGGPEAPPVAPSPGASGPRTAGGPVPLSSLSGRIAFGGRDDVWVINADGTGLRRLTHSPWPEFDPSLSPGGRFIAYRSEPGGQPEVWVMKADGSGRHRLTRDGGFPAWSPDGSMIAYAPGGGASGRSGIAVMSADGSGQRRVPRTDWGEYRSWSPDGNRIAFNSDLSGGPLMGIVDVGGSRVVDLSGVGEGGQVAWSPDGRSILFASRRDHPDNYRDVYVLRPDGSGVRRLTRGGGETPAWSPDGRYIVFSAPAGLGVMRADGSGATPLPVEGAGEASFPAWR